MLYRMDLTANFFPVGISERQNLRICDTIDIDGRPRMVVERGVIRGPPGRHGELQNIHLRLIIDVEGFQTTAQHKILPIDLVPLADDDLPLLIRMLLEMRYEIIQLFIVNRNNFADMLF